MGFCCCGEKIKYEQHTKESYIEKLKASNTKNGVILEKFFEFDIEGIKQKIKKKEVEYLPEFEIGEYEWKINLTFDKKNLFINLINNNDKNEYICIKPIYFFHTCENYTYNWTNYECPYFCIGNTKNKEYKVTITKKIFKKYIKRLIKKDKITFGLYFFIYNNNELNEYLQNLKDLIVYDDYKFVEDSYYEINIENLKANKFNSEKLCRFTLYNNSQWLIDNGKKQKSFPFYIILQNPNSEILYVNYVMVVRQPNDFSTYKARASSRLKLFSEQYHTFGFFPFAKIKEIETFTVIGVYLRFYRNKKIVHPGNIDIQLMSKKTDKQIKKLDSITTNENDIPLTEPDIDNDSYDRTENSNSSFSEDLTENNSDYTVYSKYKYIGSKPEEISVNKGVKLAVTDWNAKEGWVKVYQVGNKNNKGLYPINYIINSIKC